MTEYDHLWSLIGKKLSGEATELMQCELQRQFLDYPVERKVTEILNDWFQSGPPIDLPDADNAYKGHLKRMRQNRIEFPYDTVK